MGIEETKINETVHETALVLANAGELASAIISKIAGNDISTAVNGSPLTRGMIQNLVSRGIQKSIERRISQR
jgi:hypothetical protein